jgi:hypothetical protein
MRSGSHTEAKKHIEKKKNERYHIKNDILKESRFVGIPKPFCFIHNRKKIVLSIARSPREEWPFYPGFMPVLENVQSMHFNNM